MTVAIVEPTSFTVVSANQNTGFPASNANVDYASLVWRSNDLTTVHVILDLGTLPVDFAYDCVALIGTNLRATDTVRVRTGTTNTGIGSFDSGTVNAFTGFKSNAVTAKAIIMLSAARNERFVRIDVTSTGNPAGFVEAQRIVVGARINELGIDADAELGFKDYSVVTEFRGGEVMDEFQAVPEWGFTISDITDVKWRTEFYPMLLRCKSTRGVLFIPVVEAPEQWQNEAIFGRFSTMAKANYLAGDRWRIKAVLTAFAA